MLTTAINFLQELHHLTSSVLAAHTDGVLVNIFHEHKLQVDRDITGEVTTSLCKGNPINKAIEKGGPSSSAYQRKQYYKANFNVVEPVQYVLDAKENRTFQ